MKIFSFFHINTSFSSIEKKNIKSVIESCYWPLLHIIENNNFKIAIEASAMSLLEINKYDKKWIKNLKKLITEKKTEFIGSGYSQSIFPLIPYEVNIKNLELGNKVYKKLLGVQPKIALANEQVFSPNLISAYKKNNYHAIILDWKNFKLANKNISNNLEFEPQIIENNYKEKLKVIWNNSLNFQKFQNYIHGELEKNKFLSFLKKNYKNKFFCLYSNDAEVFNYRPGRFETESLLMNKNEWYLIHDIYKELEKVNSFIFPSELLKNKIKRKININNAAFPLTKKKQAKYNIIRWAVTGRNDLLINTYCHKIFSNLKKNNISNIKYWKKLIYFWSSDFRTHITKRRWTNYLKEINFFLKKIKEKKQIIKINKIFFNNKKNKISFSKEKKILNIDTDNVELSFNTNKGLTIESYTDHRISEKSIFGKIEKGYFNQINFDVDFYSCFFQMVQSVDNKKITDLSCADSDYKIFNSDKLLIEKKYKFNNFEYKKTYLLDIENKKFRIINNFYKVSANFLRFNYITLNPESFNFNKLYFATHNGGRYLEKFFIKNYEFNYGEHISTICSATSGVSMTSGIFIIADNSKKIEIINDNNESNLLTLIHRKKFNKKNLFRFCQSAVEQDDTSKNSFKNIKTDLQIKIYK